MRRPSYENAGWLSRYQNDFITNEVSGSILHRETLEDRIVLGSNTFIPNSLLLDYSNYYYEDRTAEVASG